MVEYVNLDEEKKKGPRLYKFGKYSFSTMEAKHLIIALILITVAIMVLQRDQLMVIGPVTFIMAYFFTVGLGFLLHELGHKFVAQYYGFISEFRANFMYMFIAILIAFLGFLFIAPGAVMILGRPSIKQNGIISVAGPLVNLFLAIIFIILGFLFNPGPGFLSLVITLGIWVNSFLGIFNMLPVWVLDGKKVWAWNKKVYWLVMGSLIAIFLLSMFGIF